MCMHQTSDAVYNPAASAGTGEVQIRIGTIQLLQLGTGVVQIHTCTMSIAATPLLMDIVIGTAAIMPHLTLPLFDAALRF